MREIWTTAMSPSTKLFVTGSIPIVPEMYIVLFTMTAYKKKHGVFI